LPWFPCQIVLCMQRLSFSQCNNRTHP